MSAASEELSSDWDNLSAVDRQLAALDFCGQDGEDAEEARREENVRVMVRCRPLIKPQERDGCVRVDESDKSVELAARKFQFDATFGPNTDNEQLYLRSVRKLVESSFKGYNCTVFLYGQTGTGKTYTHSSLTSSSFGHLFTLIQESNTSSRFLIRASYYELYNEDIRDLLCSNSDQPTSQQLKSNSNKPLELRESKGGGVYVKDLSCYLVNNLSELEKLKRLGDRKRTTAATRMNEHSSRSHSIFSITIETVSNQANELKRQKGPASSGDGLKSGGAFSVRVGRLHLIDLAGSERQSKSGSTGLQLREASRINLSLTCLSLVIRALTDPASTHIPYRNSKLTRLLSGSLGGNSKTLLIACISPAQASLDESLNTLRFASRTKRIKNRAKINEDPKDALLRKYKRQVEELRRRLNEEQQSKWKLVGEEEAIESLIGTTSTTTDENGQAGKQEERLAGGTGNELLKQLKFLRGKILVGGENLLEKVEMHERLLEASRNELEEKRVEELRLREKLKRKQEDLARMNESKGSLESQVANLDEKLKRVLVLYRKSKEEQRDLTSEHQQLKESLLQTIQATSKEIKFADCIIGDFISREHLDTINNHSKYDEESGEWQIKYIALGGNNIAQTKRLTEGLRAASPDQSESKTRNLKMLSNRPDPFIRLREFSRSQT